jgi:tetratricopeptide (TPR) repeat protein
MYLRGRHEWNKRTGEGMRAAVRYFRSAIEEDPGYAAAYAGLGQAYALLSYYTADAAKETAPKARAAAMKAMELDATLAEAYGALAYVEMDYYWDWGSAERNFRRALELDPGWADGHHWFAEYLTAMGRLGEASKEYERALELDPLSPIIANNQTHVYWFSRQYERAASHCRKVVAMDARFPNAHSDLGMALLALGRTEEAIGELESAARLGGGPMNGLGRLGYGYARVGRGAEARKILEQLRGERAHNGGGMMAMVLVHVGLGEEARALDWLEMARTAHAPYLRSIWKDPVYDALRGEARFRAVLRGMNLGEERGEPREDE